MSIVALRKISLIGVMEDKAAVLEAVQAFGGCHLMPLSRRAKGSGGGAEPHRPGSDRGLALAGRLSGAATPGHQGPAF
jgi:hypothetical protein